ncbi:hypothetical protein [Arthrobacter pityocampae]|uniref:hypothetical protein n=1 Tax=Arthrobacter pityocampae TaxID=547334 RepID=UPI0037368CA2
MLPDWEPRPTTEYSNQNFYRGPDDDELDGAINSVEEGNILRDNHSLIATDSEDNLKALEKMLRTVTR